MTIKHYGIAVLLFVMFVLFVLFVTSINSTLTATNYSDDFTNDSDLNISTNTARWVDGILIPDFNATLFEIWSDQSWNYAFTGVANPQGATWVNNTPSAAADSVNTVTFYPYNLGYIFNYYIAGSAAGLYWMFRPNESRHNVTLQDTVNGTMASAWYQLNNGGTTQAFVIGIRKNWDGIGDADANPFTSANGDSLYCFGGIDSALYIIESDSAKTTTLANPTFEGYNAVSHFWYNQTFRVNSTHVSCSIRNGNSGGTGGQQTGWVKHNLSNTSSGKLISGKFLFGIYSLDGANNFNMTNISVSNETNPNYFRNATYETIILNDTTTVSAVNLSLNFYNKTGSTSIPTCQIFDVKHQNSQNITIGVNTTLLTNITGLGFNCSIVSSNVNEYFLLDSVNLTWNSDARRPITINKTPDVLIIHNSQNLSVQINASALAGSSVSYNDNSTIINISSTGFIDHNATINDYGNYSINISATDGFSNATFIFWYNVTIPSSNSSFNVSYVEQNNDLGVVLNYSNINSYDGLVNETRWFKNGTRILTGDNKTFLNFNNFTYADVINLTVRLSNSEIITFFIPNISITIQDTRPAAFVGNVSNQTSVTVDIANTFEINITDTGSNISSVTAEFENPNQQRETLAFMNSSLNSAGGNIRFNGTYTPGLPTGTWYINFTVVDFAGNANSTPNRFMQFTVNAAGSSGGGGGGGGGGSSDGCAANYANVNNTCVPVGNLTKAERCGDNFCDALLGEDPFNCLKDCPFQAASFTCTDPTKPCLFNNQSFVATIVIGIFVLGVVFLQLKIRSVDDAKDKFRQLKNKLKSTVFRRKF